jgi:hypothetical protein
MYSLVRKLDGPDALISWLGTIFVQFFKYIAKNMYFLHNVLNLFKFVSIYVLKYVRYIHILANLRRNFTSMQYKHF